MRERQEVKLSFIDYADLLMIYLCFYFIVCSAFSGITENF